MRQIAIVMARGGSKRVPGKNTRKVNNKPLVGWSVFNAIQSGLFDEVIISTDDEEIAETAIAEGAKFYSYRPAQLSDDFATTAEVLHYELEGDETRHSYVAHACCCLYGTSIFASPEKLKEASEYLQAKNTELVMALFKYPHPIERSLRLVQDTGFVEHCQPEYLSARTQDLDPYFYDAGLLYFFKTAPFLKSQKTDFSTLNKTAIFLSKLEATDIDTEEDLSFAQLLMQNKKF